MESKIEATKRLQREGRWDEASRFGDEQRRRLQDQGLKRRDANEEVWRLMMEECALPSVDPVAFHCTLASYPPDAVRKTVPAEDSFVEIWWAFQILLASMYLKKRRGHAKEPHDGWMGGSGLRQENFRHIIGYQQLWIFKAFLDEPLSRESLENQRKTR